MKLNIVIQIALLSTIGGLAMNNNHKCSNDSSIALQSCQSHPNIRIQKVHGGSGGREDDIKYYRISLRYSQNMQWWPSPNKWIECKDVCQVCKSLPEHDHQGKNA